MPLFAGLRRRLFLCLAVGLFVFVSWSFAEATEEHGQAYYHEEAVAAPDVEAVYDNNGVLKHNPCCSYPCLNNGICMTQGYDSYICDCTGLDYSGDHCEQASVVKRIRKWLRPQPETVQYILTHFQWAWNIVNKIGTLQRLIMKYIYITRGNMVDSPARYTSGHEYVTLDAYYNVSYYARTLPPVPKECPTPMGVAGPKKLPDVDLVIEKFFRRSKFIPDPRGSNLIFAAYAQHFTHQFFKTDFSKGPGFTWGQDGVDASHIYGHTVAIQNQLRSFTDGKLKSQSINDEEYPPYLKDAEIHMDYPPSVLPNMKFALGHPFYGLLPGLFVYATIWLREHNRVCDILRQEHPEWNDEQIFQTTKLIIVGEIIKITVEDYVQHLSQYLFKLTFEPELTHGTSFQFSNRIRTEFNHLYHWHPLFPDYHNVSGTIYPVKDVMFNVEPVFKHGLTNFVQSMNRQRAGKLSHHNHGDALIPVLKSAIIHGRTLRLQSFNNYRRRFGLKPYLTFEALTRDKVMSAELERMYESVDAVEFLVGLFVEHDGHTVTPKTMVEIGGPYSVKGLLSNPICSPPFWKPSTFGGKVGFELVNTASLEKLFALNLKGNCGPIAFRVPPEVDEESPIKDEL